MCQVGFNAFRYWNWKLQWSLILGTCVFKTWIIPCFKSQIISALCLAFLYYFSWAAKIFQGCFCCYNDEFKIYFFIPLPVVICGCWKQQMGNFSYNKNHNEDLFNQIRLWYVLLYSVIKGVPQGSTLSPTLFSVCTVGIANGVGDSSIHLMLHDTVLNGCY